jgi:hypothetical protein
MIKKIIFSILIVILIFDANSFELKFPDSNGLLLPGYTYSEEDKADSGFYARQYKINNSTENVYSLYYNYRTSDLVEFGILKKMYSQDNLKDPDMIYSIKLNIADYMFRNIYTLGLLIDSDDSNYNSIYVMKDNIGFGYNFSGKNGGDAFFGGYDNLKDEADSFFILLRHVVELNEKTRFGIEFNGDDISLYIKQRYSNSIDFTLGYINENDYDKKYTMLNDDRIVIGVDCVF